MKNEYMSEKTRARLAIFVRRLFVALLDAICVNAAYVIVCSMDSLPLLPEVQSSLLSRALYTTLIYLVVYSIFGLYNSLWEYAGMYELTRCFCATAIATLVSVGADTIADRLAFFEVSVLRVSTYFGSMMMIMVLTAFIRGFYRFIRRRRNGRAKCVSDSPSKKRRVMIVGAGDMGMAILQELEAKSFVRGKPVVFVDDSLSKQGRRIEGIPIVGGCENIPDIAKKHRVDDIIFALPTIDQEKRHELYKLAMQTGCTLKTAPTLTEITENKTPLTAIRNVEITDLLARPEIKLNTDICSYLRNKVVMVTGGGGSIGSEICAQVARYTPSKIIVFDNYENNAFYLKNKLDRLYRGEVEFVIRIGSVQDPNRLREVMREFKPSVVFHAAAHKHVPLMEDSPCEAVKNNIFGTYNTAQVASESGVEKFVILSTDKAVNPTNVMGATKRVTELIIQYFERKNTGTHFAAVRFGNVLGSNGSVIPIFKDQIEHGGPVTVTHKDITRYFMTIPEAAQLVVQAGGIAKGGEIFVLDMGEPVSITSLAEKIISLSGYKPYEDINIEFTGLRPGEKLYEELTLSEEEGKMEMTANNKIFVLPPVRFDDDNLEKGLEQLKKVNGDTVREVIKELVPNYRECSNE